jgi:hypothetical protein
LERRNGRGRRSRRVVALPGLSIHALSIGTLRPAVPLIAGLLIVASCTNTGGPPAPPAHKSLGGAVAARVAGDVDIGTSLVADVARAQSTTPAAALDGLIGDALAAKGAKARKLDDAPDVRRERTAALARLVATRVRDAARAEGPPTDAEVAELSQRHASEVDRPESVRVIHAIALRPKKDGDPAPAREVATALEEAVRGATTADDFEARAKAVPHPAAVDVRVERLPAFAQDGHIVEGGTGGMDATFASAAFRLSASSPLSAIVETPFGWHVIRLLERLPANVVPLEDRRRAFTEEVRQMRAQRAYDALLGSLRQSRAVEILPDAEPAMVGAFPGKN